MTAQGLLVEGPNGEDYLLTTEPNLGGKSHRLVVRKKQDGKWKDLNRVQESVCREALIGAFVDFFVDLCRVLNSSSQHPVAVMQSSQARRPRVAQLSLHTGGGGR